MKRIIYYNFEMAGEKLKVFDAALQTGQIIKVVVNEAKVHARLTKSGMPGAFGSEQFLEANSKSTLYRGIRKVLLNWGLVFEKETRMSKKSAKTLTLEQRLKRVEEEKAVIERLSNLELDSVKFDKLASFLHEDLEIEPESSPESLDRLKKTIDVSIAKAASAKKTNLLSAFGDDDET